MGRKCTHPYTLAYTSNPKTSNLVIVLVTQCRPGGVMDLYETGPAAVEAGEMIPAILIPYWLKETYTANALSRIYVSRDSNI
jgi:hypothetical protein